MLSKLGKSFQNLNCQTKNARFGNSSDTCVSNKNKWQGLSLCSEDHLKSEMTPTLNWWESFLSYSASPSVTILCVFMYMSIYNIHTCTLDQDALSPKKSHTRPCNCSVRGNIELPTSNQKELTVTMLKHSQITNSKNADLSSWKLRHIIFMAMECNMISIFFSYLSFLDIDPLGLFSCCPAILYDI